MHANLGNSLIAFERSDSTLICAHCPIEKKLKIIDPFPSYAVRVSLDTDNLVNPRKTDLSPLLSLGVPLSKIALFYFIFRILFVSWFMTILGLLSVLLSSKS